MSMFSKLSANEQKLIGLAAILCVVLGGWQFLIKPISQAKTKSQAAYQTAVRDYNIVQNGLPRLTRAAPQSSGKQAFNRSALIETARSVNIAISRVQPASNNELQVWFDEASSSQIYGFLQILDNQYAVETLSAQVNRRKDGLVSAQFKFMPINTP